MAWLKRVKGSPNWYVAWREGPRERLRSTQTCDRRLAERIRAQIAADVVAGKFGLADHDGMRLTAAADAYVAHSREIHRPRTTDAYLWALRALRTYLDGDPQVANISAEHVRGLWTAFAWGATSRAIAGRHLRSFFNWCRRQGWATVNPVQVPRAPRGGARTAFMTLDDVAALLRAETHAAACELWTFLLLTGARAGETLALRWRDVDLRGVLIIIQAAETKSGRAHGIEITDELRDLLIKMRARRSAADLHPEARLWPWTRGHATHRFKRIVRAAGLRDDLTLHSLRHTAASWWIMSGVDLRVVSELLNHGSVAVTAQHYTHLLRTFKASQMARTPLTQLFRDAVNTDDK